MKRMTSQRAKRQGFTLMELLVVLGILVLLIAIVTPRIIGTQEKADKKAAQIQLGMFKGALEHYQLNMKGFPAAEQGLKALVSKPSDEDGNTGANWDGPYLDEIPKDPWGNEFQYEYPPVHGKGKNPDIWSYGPDGEDGTDDDIVNWKKQAGESEGDPDSEEDRDTEMNLDTEMDMDTDLPPGNE